MIFRIPRLIEHISSIMTIEVCLSSYISITVTSTNRPTQEGDLILTGTPSGVGPLTPGDNVECALTDPEGKELATLNFDAVLREVGYSYQTAK